MKNKSNLLIMLALTLFVSCAGKTGGNNDSEQDPPQTQPAEPDFDLVNAEKDGNQISLNSFRYRNVYSDYNAGISSVKLPIRTTLTMSEADIKVFIKVEASDLSRVQGGKVQSSDQPWSEFSFNSQVTGDIVKICVQIQPSQVEITQAGEIEMTPLRKKVYTALGDKNCVGISANGVDVFDGIDSNYLVVDADTKITAETKMILKQTHVLMEKNSV